MMNVFKRKSVYAAILAGLGAVGVAGSASAVHINPDGLGQALIYPYYTVRAGNDTYLSVVNTTSSAKAVKVRFLEGKSSKEVLDFNLYLSPYDVWTGAIVATTNGAKLITTDNSCTTPSIPKPGGKEFVNYQFSGTLVDGEDATLDRTREGYFEILEMGDLLDATYIDNITHVNGVPADCGAMQDVTLINNVDISVPTGGLSGKAELLAPALGTAFGFDAVAIDTWATDSSLWYAPGSIYPNLDTPNGPSTSNVFNAGAVRSSIWTTSVDAVSATMMHDNVINEFMLDTGTLSGTDWVVTMPTKNLYVPLDTDFVNPRTHDAPFPPFAEAFGEDGSCDPVALSLHDREEATAPGDFSPLPPGQVSALCWEANVVTFNNSGVLGSTNSTNVNTSYQNGWMNMGLVDDSAVNFLTNETDTYFGLPVVGFMVQDYTNNNAAPGIMATYGNNFNHKFTRDITP